jgi:rod shape-determining protein MreD
MMVIRNVSLMLLAFLFQSAGPDIFAIRGIRPDFLLIMLVYVALSSGSLTGVLLGFFTGLVQDFYGPATNLGLNALCKTLVGFTVGLGRERLYKDRLSILMMVLFTAHLIHDALYMLVDLGFDLTVYWSVIREKVLPTALYTVITGLALAMLFAFRRGHFNARRIFLR